MTSIALRRATRRPAGLLQWLSAALAVRDSRTRLAELPDAVLADIGITREQARIEADRPLWDIPAWWRP